ncbi:MAG: hypothetical protein IKI36_05875 [Prevotella sp.]|nr:hypothetical protein [Prevotella sp.]
MKTKEFFHNSSRVLTVFLLTGAVVVAIWCASTYDKSMAMSYTQDNETVMSGTLSNLFSNAEMKRVQEINVEIGKLEQKKAKVMKELEQIQSDRNKNHAMVAGMYFQPAQDVPEMAVLKGQVEKIDNKIVALNNKGRNLALK